jgi:hypothetical protein
MIYLALIVSLAVPTASEPSRADEFIGLYKYTDTANGDKAIEAAVDKATEELNFIVRPIVRSKIKQNNVAPESITMRQVLDEVLIKTQFRAWTTDLKSTPLTVSLPGGRTGTVAKTIDGTDLIEVVSVAQTTRTQRYRLSVDAQQLSIQVTIVTPKLSEPLVYELLYKRYDK